MTGKRTIPVISVGVLSASGISFTLNSVYREDQGRMELKGRWNASVSGSMIMLRQNGTELSFRDGITFSPAGTEDASFTLHDVTIGVNFHWQRSEDQVFRGDLKLIAEGGKVTAVNVISIEEYLRSVISSEMSASSSSELLKAHAVISRGWLLAQISKGRSKAKNRSFNPDTRTDNEIIKWYDREDHLNFDVCADDHCQRYQGITRASVPAAGKAVEETSGEVLTYSGAICDTRYYKCCGGITELFENVWEPVNHPYLQKVMDNPSGARGFDRDLTVEANARRWILGSPESFCRTSDKNILGQVLNDYDQETVDFFRWKVRYEQSELSSLVKSKTGIDFGQITDLKSLGRGVSGRITRLLIAGTKKKMVIGKELEIRKALSESHLYSSCFFAEKVFEGGKTWFILHGAGWGHGVGLCQIGAAVMGSKGYSYSEILNHYFPGSVLERKY